MLYNEKKRHFFNSNQDLQWADPESFARGGPTQTMLFSVFLVN